MGKLNPRILGYILMGVGGLLGLIGIWLLYSGTMWWLMTASLRQAGNEAFTNQAAQSRQTATKASGWTTTSSTLLASVQPGTDGAASVLTQARQAASGHAERQAVASAQALDAKLRGDKPDLNGVRNGDVKLFRHWLELDDFRGPRLPDLPDLGRDAPSMAVLRCVLEARLHKAWLIGDPVSLSADCGRIQTIAPRHPAIRHFTMLQTWTASHHDETHMRRVAMVPGSQEGRWLWLRSVMHLVALHPETFGADDSKREELLARRKLVAARIIPPHMRNPQEEALISGSQATSQGLQGLVNKAMKTKTPTAVSLAMTQALAQGKTTIARNLLTLVPADAQAGVEQAIAEAEWDLPKLMRSGETGQAWVPRVRHLRIADDHFALHLAAANGLLPRQPLTVTLDGTPVATTSITRHGTALLIPKPRGSGLVQLNLAIGAVGLFSKEVKR